MSEDWWKDKYLKYDWVYGEDRRCVCCGSATWQYHAECVLRDALNAYKEEEKVSKDQVEALKKQTLGRIKRERIATARHLHDAAQMEYVYFLGKEISDGVSVSIRASRALARAQEVFGKDTGWVGRE